MLDLGDCGYKAGAPTLDYSHPRMRARARERLHELP